MVHCSCSLQAVGCDNSSCGCCLSEVTVKDDERARAACHAEYL